MADSLIAPVFGKLEGLRDSFVGTLYPDLGQQISPFLEAAFEVYVLIWAANVVINPGSFKQQVISFLKISFGLVLVFTMLGQDSKTSPVFAYFISPVEMMSIELGKHIIATFGSGVPPTTGSLYGGLAAMMEQQAVSIWSLCDFIFKLAGMKGLAGSVPATIYAIFICAVLASPFLFVFAYFTFCLAEVLFKLLLMGSLSPIFLVCALFKPVRPWAFTAAKIVAGSALSIPFLSVALGFTMAVVQPRIDEAASMQVCLGNDAPDFCQSLKLDIYTWTQDPNFLLLLALGWVSVLSHLSARRLSSEVTAHTDTGSATAITAGMFSASAALTKAAGLKGAQLTASAAQAVGGGFMTGGSKAMDLAQHFLGNGTTPVTSAPPPMVQPSASGGASGPINFSSETTEALKQFTETMKQFNQRFRG